MKQCQKCHRERDDVDLINGKCRWCREQEEEDNRPTPGPGDMFGTGLPGGIDLDFTTPY